MKKSSLIVLIVAIAAERINYIVLALVLFEC